MRHVSYKRPGCYITVEYCLHQNLYRCTPNPPTILQEYQDIASNIASQMYCINATPASSIQPQSNIGALNVSYKVTQVQIVSNYRPHTTTHINLAPMADLRLYSFSGNPGVINIQQLMHEESLLGILLIVKQKQNIHIPTKLNYLLLINV